MLRIFPAVEVAVAIRALMSLYWSPSALNLSRTQVFKYPDVFDVFALTLDVCEELLLYFLADFVAGVWCLCLL